MTVANRRMEIDPDVLRFKGGELEVVSGMGGAVLYNGKELSAQRITVKVDWEKDGGRARATIDVIEVTQ